MRPTVDWLLYYVLIPVTLLTFTILSIRLWYWSEWWALLTAVLLAGSISYAIFACWIIPNADETEPPAYSNV